MADASAHVPAVVDDCWNRIGIRGDASCPELTRHVHCRNCPVFAAAAARLLDAPAPQGYLAQWTGLYAGEKAHAGDDGLPLFLFRVEAEWLALPAETVREIAPLRPVHSLPRRGGGAVQGVTNVRGKLLACVSLGNLLGLEQAAAERVQEKGRWEARRLLVADAPGGLLSFPIDEAYGIVRPSADALGAVPATVAGAVAVHTRAVLSWEGRTVGCLDAPGLFEAVNRSLA